MESHLLTGGFHAAWTKMLILGCFIASKMWAKKNVGKEDVAKLVDDIYRFPLVFTLSVSFVMICTPPFI